MYNDLQYNGGEYNDSIKAIIPVRTKTPYPKTGQNLIVWSPDGEITSNSITTTFPT